MNRKKKKIAQAAVCTAATLALTGWYGNELMKRTLLYDRVVSSISTEQAANDLEKILTEELDELQKAGGKIRNHRQYLLTNRHTDPEGHAKEAAVIEEAGIEIYEKMIRPAARKLDGRTYSPDPRICTGTYQSALMMHKILLPAIIFGFAGAMIAQSRIFYRAARETKSKIGKAARYTAITGMAAALPLLSLAGAEAYQRVRPITNHYAPYFNEINASAGRCYVTTPHDVALVLYHESRHAKQFRTDNQPWIFNGVFVEGEVRMRERIMARELTRTTRDAAFLESTATRTIPELAGVYLYACRESRMPANLFLLARVAREAGPYLGAELEEHSLGTAIYMMAINNAGEEIVERAPKQEYGAIVDAAQGKITIK